MEFVSMSTSVGPLWFNNERSKMITSSRVEKDLQAKEEGETNDTKLSKPPSSSRQWSAFRNARIVRVSRSFGGKDRHSKVCTTRGLRDRRIRLSVPTAIQLYDLQDRLGLNQPSKVIDWLLNVCKNDIDKLPPLQIPQGFNQFQSAPMFLSHESSASQSTLSPFFDANSTFIKDGGFHSLGVKIGSGLQGEDSNTLARSKYWEVEASLRGKNKEVEIANDKGKWVRTNEEENQDGVGDCSSQISAHKLFPLSSSYSSLHGFLTNSMPFNSYYHLDASNLSLAQMGSHAFLPQNENSLTNNNNVVPLPSQLLFCPTPTTLPSLFPTYPPYVPTAIENDPREINHFQLQSSNNLQHMMQNPRATSYPVRPFTLNVSPGVVHLDRNDDSQPQDIDNTQDS